MVLPQDNGLELGLRLSRMSGLSRRRSPVPEAELSQEGIRWSDERQRYVAEGSLDITATSTLVGDHAEDGVPHARDAVACSPEKAEPAGEPEKPREDVADGHDSSPIMVEWDGPDDPENPFNWSSRRRWVSTVVVCLNTFLVSYVGSSFGAGSAGMIAEWGITREIAAVGLAV